MNTYIFDIDGTLADITHRLGYIKGAHISEDNPPDWDAFHDAMEHDTVIEDVAKILRLVSKNNYILLITGRREEWRAETIDWLLRNNIWFQELLMRPANDHGPDYIVKRELFQTWRARNPDGDVIGVFDDRSHVVEMWRSLGLTCFQPAKGDY